MSEDDDLPMTRRIDLTPEQSRFSDALFEALQAMNAPAEASIDRLDRFIVDRWRQISHAQDPSPSDWLTLFIADTFEAEELRPIACRTCGSTYRAWDARDIRIVLTPPWEPGSGECLSCFTGLPLWRPGG